MTKRRMVTLHVTGTPAPQGSKRAYVRGNRAVLVESSAKVRPWREAVKSAALDAAPPTPRWGRDDPLAASVLFYLPRPRSHYGTGRNADRIRPAAPTFPAVQPDVDKLLRSTFDGLGDAGVWHDDSRVVFVHVSKAYADGRAPGATIAVWSLQDDDDDETPPNPLHTAAPRSGEAHAGQSPTRPSARPVEGKSWAGPVAAPVYLADPDPGERPATAAREAVEDAFHQRARDTAHRLAARDVDPECCARCAAYVANTPTEPYEPGGQA